MTDIPLTIASGSYDRTRALKEGSVRIDGCAVTYTNVEPTELFKRNLRSPEFDVSEMSFSTYIVQREQGNAAYTAIPVFLSRAFRHSAIFVRTDRGIETPADLKGKRVGTPEYFTTMLVWMRGLLSDEYGIKPSDLRWRLGPLEQPARPAPVGEALGAPPSAPSPLVGEGRGGGSRGYGEAVPHITTSTSQAGGGAQDGREGPADVEIEAIPGGKTLAG